jgi:hypothetical protein
MSANLAVDLRFSDDVAVDNDYIRERLEEMPHCIKIGMKKRIDVLDKEIAEARLAREVGDRGLKLYRFKAKSLYSDRLDEITTVGPRSMQPSEQPGLTHHQQMLAILGNDRWDKIALEEYPDKIPFEILEKLPPELRDINSEVCIFKLGADPILAIRVKETDYYVAVAEWD